MGFLGWLLRGLVLPVAVGGLVAYFLMQPSAPQKAKRTSRHAGGTRSRRGPRPSRKSPARHGRKRAKAVVRARA